MDINRFKELSIPKIESGKITKLVRDVIKNEKDLKQDIQEQRKEDYKVITDKLESEIKEISNLRENINKQLAISGNQQLAIDKPPQLIADKIESLDFDNKTIKKYRNRINLIKGGIETLKQEKDYIAHRKKEIHIKFMKMVNNKI